MSTFAASCTLAKLLTLDNGFVTAPVKENADRRLGAAVHLVSLIMEQRQAVFRDLRNMR